MLKFLISFLTSSIGATTFSISSAHADDQLDQEKALSREYVARMAAEPGAVTLEGGVIFRPLHTHEQGAQPTISDTVKVIYQLWDREGHLVDDGFGTDDIPVFPLLRLIRCWQIAIPQMRTGSLAKITCPSETAYGDRGAGDGAIKPGAALTFRVGLLAFEKTL